MAIHIAVKRTLIAFAQNVREAAILSTECYPQCIGSKHSWRVGEESVSHSGKSSERPRAGDFIINHNYNKILKSDWFSTALISALIEQFNRTVRVMPK